MDVTAQQKIEKYFTLSGKRFLYWLSGFVLGPFCLFFVLVLSGTYGIYGFGQRIDGVLIYSFFCAVLAAILGFMAFTISLIGTRFWFLVASYMVPLISIGGFWGTWSWFKSSSDFARTYPDQTRDLSLVEELLEWLSFVKAGCFEMGLLPAILIGTGICVTFFYYSRKKPDQ